MMRPIGNPNSFTGFSLTAAFCMNKIRYSCSQQISDQGSEMQENACSGSFRLQVFGRARQQDLIVHSSLTLKSKLTVTEVLQLISYQSHFTPHGP